MQTKIGQTSNEEKTNLRGNITVWLTSCLFCLDSVALLILNEHQLYLMKYEPVKQEVRRTLILPPMVNVLCRE